ncbi:MAG: MBL fold metallo-hydrolase [Acholeplasmatales bacterium]|nr:MBL fold metallo-hydrolase [Acholeplasmatales bacterium]
MKLLQIASGSKGNATFIESNNTRILIDCGISKKRISDALDNENHLIEDLDAILITHEHTDHVSGLVPVIRATSAKIYLTRPTYDGLPLKTREVLDSSRVVFISNNLTFSIKDIIIETVQIFHDARDPIGFVLRAEGKKIVYITDTGYVHEAFLEKLKNADLYVFESNHDPEILMNSDRTYATKMRILGDHGHLSNEDSAYLMTKLIGENTKYILLAHLSEECNLPSLAVATYQNVFAGERMTFLNAKLKCCSQEPLKEINL